LYLHAPVANLKKPMPRTGMGSFFARISDCCSFTFLSFNHTVCGDMKVTGDLPHGLYQLIRMSKKLVA